MHTINLHNSLYYVQYHYFVIFLIKIWSRCNIKFKAITESNCQTCCIWRWTLQSHILAVWTREPWTPWTMIHSQISIWITWQIAYPDSGWRWCLRKSISMHILIARIITVTAYSTGTYLTLTPLQFHSSQLFCTPTACKRAVHHPARIQRCKLFPTLLPEWFQDDQQYHQE